MWDKIANCFEFKLILALFAGMLGYLFDPTQYLALLALFLLILGDFIFGIFAAKTTGMTSTSAKFYRTPIKIAVYFSLIAICHISEYTLPVMIGFLDETMTGFLAATELLSILEKAGIMGYAIPRKLLNQLEKYKTDC
jgi:toxin secretion/phage lysis holin